MQNLEKLPTKTQRVVLLRRLGFSFYQIAKIIYKARDWREANKKAFQAYLLFTKGQKVYDEGDDGYMTQVYEGGERDPLRQRAPVSNDRVQLKKRMSKEERQIVEYEEFMYELLVELRVHHDKVLWETARYIHYKLFDDLKDELDCITKQKYGYRYRRRSADSACAYAFVVLTLAALMCGRAPFKELLKKHLLENYVSEPSFFAERVRSFWRRALEKLFPL